MTEPHRPIAPGLRTIASLVEEALASTPPDDPAVPLFQAAAQASSFHEWKPVLDALARLSRIAPAKRDALLADAARVAGEQADAWLFRAVAILLASDPGGVVQARSTLAACEETLARAHQAGEAVAYAWGVLADGYKTALSDETEARRCLEEGWKLAWASKNVEHLGRLSGQWATLLSRPEAVERLASVEKAAVAWGNLGGLIYFWHNLGDAAAGRRVRQEVLRTSTEFADVIELVRYWHLYETESPGVELALARAEELARTPGDWFTLAETGLFNGKNAGVARRALDRAAAGAESAALRVVVANAYVDWFKDEAAAKRAGPRGESPGTTRPLLRTLDGWSASATSLFDALRARVTPAILTHIAEADYGSDVEEHRAALAAMCTTGLLPERMAWHPGEVVELTRWRSGEGVDHLARALSCVLLCLASPDAELITNGPILVESAILLGGDVPGLAAELLAWKIETDEDGGGEMQVARAALFLLRGRQAPDDPRLPSLLESIVLDARSARSLREWMATSLRSELWEELLSEIIPQVAERQPRVVPLLEALNLAR